LAEIQSKKLSKVKIAVVDDEEVMRRLVTEILKGEGYEVSTFSNALEALETVKQENFDLILTDLKMPEMDGMELIRSAHKVDPDIGAIFMTGYASLSSAREAVKEGAYDYILKPFDLTEVRNSVAKAIQKRATDQEKVREKELNRLLDLDKIMFRSGDFKDLLKLSLTFALMQSDAPKGSIIFLDVKKKNLEIVLIDNLSNQKFKEKRIEISTEVINVLCNVTDLIQAEKLLEHIVFTSLQNNYPDISLLKELLKQGERSVSLPIRRGSKTIGLLTLNQRSSDKIFTGGVMKLLSIVTEQTALSLENLVLLDESRESFGELKELQEQLIQMEKMATRGQQSAEIGHEMNNYLTVVMGNLQKLEISLNRGESEQTKKHLELISEHLERIVKFIQGLMDFSVLKTEKKLTNINQLVDKVLGYVRVLGRFKNINFLKELGLDIPQLHLDTGQIQQLLYNLLNNSADAMGKRKGEGGTITLRTCYHKEDNRVLIEVVDTGEGIAPEIKEKLFKNRLTTKEHGHGFGLLTCKRIVESHKGKIEVESKPGDGATFRIKLPLNV
jgi:signal transduction histidine kinase/FixJ family two-component response regulator